MSAFTRASCAVIALVASAVAQAAPPAQDVTAITAEQLRAGFAKGAPLLENDAYKIHASRRDAAGAAEVHLRDTDTIFVQSGGATLVTGGRVIDPKTVAPDEIRGASIAGGVARKLAPGDVVVIPNGVPHWFQTVEAPLTYYVVKVTAANPASAQRAIVDLMTAEGAAQVGAQWRHADVDLVEAMHRAPDADGQPNGAPVETWDYAPHAGVAGFDDSRWAKLDPAKTNARLGNGRLSFHWYRVAVTVPEKLGDFDPRGAAVYFDTTLDDYAEVWVDGAIARGLGQVGGSVIAGWNARNHVLLSRSATPGQRIEIAVFAANGPLSDPPANFIWMREAKLVFEQPGAAGPIAVAPREVNVAIDRLDPALDAIVPSNPKLYELAEGFQFTEGPVWVRERGVLLFSDPNANRIYQYDPRGDGALGVFREQSGYDGADIAEYRQPGSNGITVDPQGRIANDEHGRRRVVRLERDGTLAVLADRYQGKRLNSPNDLVFRSDGALFFTDPFFGLPRFQNDPRRELDFAGVYVWKDGTLRLLTDEFSGPNGIALSPDEKSLYVGNWDDHRKIVMRYDLAADGGVANGRVFADLTPIPGEDAIDGVKVDQRGNVYVSGPGGLQVYAPDGKHLGTIRTPQHAHNFAWGGDDGRTLYLAARSRLYRMPLQIPGVRP